MTEIIELWSLDNQTSLKPSWFSNSPIVSVSHNSNQNIHLNASLISSSISPSCISLNVKFYLMVSLTDSPRHQPHQLIEGDTPVTVLVHLPHQLPQLPLGGAPAECPHDLAELHSGDGSTSVPEEWL